MHCNRMRLSSESTENFSHNVNLKTCTNIPNTFVLILDDSSRHVKASKA
jgi:hypothetical protein